MAIEGKARGAGLRGQRKGQSIVGFPSRLNCVASTAAQRFVLALLAEKQWIPNSWDLQQPCLKVSPSLVIFFVVLPIDFVGIDLVCRLKKPMYGIVSAPKSWFDRLIEVCRAAELITATTDEGLLIMTSVV
jgi:hypothetical protein